MIPALAALLLGVLSRGGQGPLGNLFRGAGGFLGNLFRGRPDVTAPGWPMQTPTSWGGRTFVRTPGEDPTGVPWESLRSVPSGTQVYGHTLREGVPTFSMPGAGGGDVAIPHLAAAAQAGDPFASGAIGRQGESAGRMSAIDALIDLMWQQGAQAPPP